MARSAESKETRRACALVEWVAARHMGIWLLLKAPQKPACLLYGSALFLMRHSCHDTKLPPSAALYTMAPCHPVLPTLRVLHNTFCFAGSTEAETVEQAAQGSAGPSRGPGRPEDQQGLAPTQLQACRAFCKASAHICSLVCDTGMVKCKRSRCLRAGRAAHAGATRAEWQVRGVRLWRVFQGRPAQEARHHAGASIARMPTMVLLTSMHVASQLWQLRWCSMQYLMALFTSTPQLTALAPHAGQDADL